jgi:deoxycytidylate deaminase
MRRVVGQKLEQIVPFFELAAQVAADATCHRAKCGSVIVKDGVVIGTGYNAPPRNNESRRTCDNTWDYDKKPKYDLTCCVHAEWRAVIDACKTNADKISGSVLYFMRIDENGNFTNAGDPYCTTCSRFTMESGIDEFALWNNNGADIYSLPEYDELSYAFYHK